MPETKLKRVADGPAIVACNTCRRTVGLSGGARLVAALRSTQASEPRFAGISVQEMSCLFACAASCTIQLRAPGKIGYVLGGFMPTDEDARAILDFAASYAESEIGEVPYSDWPERVKGHFLVRIPPASFVIE